jgi:probable HAF family extracellular repeat protein
MKPKTKSLTVTVPLAAVLALAAAQPCAADVPSPTPIDLGALPGLSFSAACGINASGQVVGHSYNADSSVNLPFIWQNGVMTPLPLPANSAQQGLARGINASGQVVGACIMTETGDNQACLWQLNGNDWAVTALGVPAALTYQGITAFTFTGSIAYEINDTGQVLAQTLCNEMSVSVGCIWQNGAWTVLTNSSGAPVSLFNPPLQINERGQVLLVMPNSRDEDWGDLGLWGKGTVTLLTQFIDWAQMNNSGQVVGVFYDRFGALGAPQNYNFTYDSSRSEPLTYSEVSAAGYSLEKINDNGQVLVAYPTVDGVKTELGLVSFGGWSASALVTSLGFAPDYPDYSKLYFNADGEVSGYCSDSPADAFYASAAAGVVLLKGLVQNPTLEVAGMNDSGVIIGCSSAADGYCHAVLWRPPMTWNVTSTADDGTQGTLRYALLNAVDGDVINITATGTIALASGALNVANSVTITGPGQDKLTVDGQHVSQVFTAWLPDKTVTISGLTIANGGSHSYYCDGGGVFNAGALTLSDCTLSGNSALYSGGGVSSSGYLRITRCTLSGNWAGVTDAYEGGGAVACLAQGANATLIIESSVLTNNTAPYGGGISIYVEGGAGFPALASVTVTDSTLSGNSANVSSGLGGGMAIQVGGDNPTDSSAMVAVENSTLSGNSANVPTTDGVEGCGIGGAIANAAWGGGATLTVENSTLSGNWASGGGNGYGGAIYNFNSTGSALVTLDNCTLSGNYDDLGACGIGVVGGGVATVKNTILANNPSGANLAVGDPTTDTITSDGYNLCADGGGGFLTATGDQINKDPVLGPLADNGGPTWTCALLPGSPAIDAAASTDSAGNPVTTDQRGVTRPQGAANDIGAFELEEKTQTTIVANKASARYGDASAPLTATVTAQSPSTAIVNEGTVTFTVTQGGTVIGTVTSGTVANGSASASLPLAGVNAGSYAINANYNPAANNPGYGAASTTTPGMLTVGKVNASINVTPYSVTYNGTAHTATGSAKGVLGETLAGLNLSGTTHTAAGTYATDPWTFTDSTGNYNNTSGAVGDSIAQAKATITVTPYSVTYNGTAHTATGSAKGVLGETLAGLNLSGTTHTAAGTYATDPWTFTDRTGNYKNSFGWVADQVTPATLTITPKSTIKIDGQTLTFQGTEFTISGGQLFNGDRVASVQLNSFGAAAWAPVGSYSIFASDAAGSGLSNYRINYASGTLSIQYEPAGVSFGGEPGHVILPPINANGTSIFKQGGTVAAQFRVFDAHGNSVGTPGVVQKFTLVKVVTGTQGTVVNEPASTTTPDTAFYWDQITQQWVFHLGTRQLVAGKTYFYEIDLNDGTSICFSFGLK